MECCVHKSTRPTFCGGRESILNLISIFLLHFDICLSDLVVLAYPTKRRLTIGNSRIDLPLIQRDLLFRIPSQNLKMILKFIQNINIKFLKFLKHAFYFVYLFKTAIFVTCVGSKV